ncbi:hypothetical protein B0H19DRAFT_1061235 [Mycena capillaripes]|nr:hypothetical protein B0H19DRAFT_1061235 [Mycena capillaripes]
MVSEPSSLGFSWKLNCSKYVSFAYTPENAVTTYAGEGRLRMSSKQLINYRSATTRTEAVERVSPITMDQAYEGRSLTLYVISAVLSHWALTGPAIAVTETYLQVNAGETGRSDIHNKNTVFHVNVGRFTRFRTLPVTPAGHTEKPMPFGIGTIKLGLNCFLLHGTLLNGKRLPDAQNNQSTKKLS